MRKGKKELAIGLILIVLCLVTMTKSPNFLTVGNLQNISRLLGIHGILGIGIAFVIVTGGIDLSIGSVICLLGVLLSMTIGQVNSVLAFILILAGGALLGAAHGALVAYGRLQAFIVTLCGLLLYRGIARYISGDSTMGFDSWKKAAWMKNLESGYLFHIPIPFILLLAIAATAFLLLHRTVYGVHLFATGQNEEAARYAGINTKRVVIVAYTICGLLVGLAAILLAGFTNSVQPSSHGNFYELYAIAAAVLGGFSLRGGEGSIIGVVLGATLLRVITNLTVLLKVPSSLEYAVMAVVIFIGAVVDSLLGRRRAR